MATLNAEANAITTLQSFVHGLKAPVTRTTISEELPQHPDFPSLLSINEILTDWKIDNTALQLNTVEQLRELPLPLIAHLQINGGWFVTVTKLTGNDITIIDSSRGKVVESLTEFANKWTGVVLIAETNENSGELNYKTNRKQEIFTSLRNLILESTLLITALITIVSVKNNLTYVDYILLFTKTTGLLLSLLLVSKQLGKSNVLTDRLCQINGKTNCDSVLNSSGSKIFSWLSWTDVGLIYFAGGLVSILIIGSQLINDQNALHTIMNSLSILALPYIIFSVYYQAKIIRQWCTLCLAVQGILLVEGLIAIVHLAPLSVTWQPYMALLISFLFPATAWMTIKPILKRINKSKFEHDELTRFKRNPDLFKAMLMHQLSMHPIPENLPLIVLGDPKGEHTITMVTNPFCGPCAIMHEEIEKLLKARSSLKVNVIFFTCDSYDELSSQILLHLLALQKINKSSEALSDWYKQEKKDFVLWSERWPIESNSLSEYASKQHCDWCKQAKIEVTPTIFVGNKKLPVLYNLKDLYWLSKYSGIDQSDNVAVLR